MPMNYVDLVAPKSTPGSIRSWISWAKVPAEVVLEEAQALLWSRLRVREMRTATTIALAVGDSSKALPGASTGQFLEPIALKSRTDCLTLVPNHPGRSDTFLSEGAMIERRIYEDDVLISGCPCTVAIFDECFQFDVKSDAARTYDLVFYQRPALLSSSIKTNFLTLRWPHLLRQATEAAAADFFKETDEYARAVARLDALCMEINAESDLGRAA